MVFLNLLYNLMAAYPLKFYTVLTDIKKHKKQKSGQDQSGSKTSSAIFFLIQIFCSISCTLLQTIRI